jgi:hypothetical protein
MPALSFLLPSGLPSAAKSSLLGNCGLSSGPTADGFPDITYRSIEDTSLILKSDVPESCHMQAPWFIQEHGRISKWMNKFGISEGSRESTKFDLMAKSKKKTDSEDVDFEKLQLQKRISELEKQVQVAEMKAIAFSTMVDIAEKEFNIPIRKKFNTKL